MKLTVIEIETYQLKEYLDKIKPYLSDIIIDLQNSDTWKVLSTIAINFIFLRDAEEEHVMHWKSDNIKFTPCNNINEFVDKLFVTFFSYQGNLETSIRGIDFIFWSSSGFVLKWHRVHFRRGESFTEYLDWIKKTKKVTINLKK